MKTAKLMTILMAAIAIIGCTGNKEKEKLGDGTKADSLQKYLMLEELPDSAHEHIRQSIATADTLLGEFGFREEGLETSYNPTVFNLMERMMVKSMNYEGTHVYAYEWACQDTIAQYFLDYLKGKGAALTSMDSLQYQKVMDAFEPILDDYCAGSQQDINSAAHIMMHVETLKTIGTYKDMVALCNNKVLRHAYFMDYAGWIDLFNEVVSRQEGGYSMFPMEANNFGTDMMQLRYRMLQEEIALKRDGATCQWDTEANKIDWSAENADLLRRWYDRRMKYADNIPDKSFAESFKVMTEKIAYFFLNTLKFGMEGEEDMDDTDD